MLTHTPTIPDTAGIADAIERLAETQPGARVRVRLRGPDGSGQSWTDWTGAEQSGTATGDVEAVSRWASAIDPWPARTAARIELLDNNGRPLPGGTTWRPAGDDTMPRAPATPPELRPAPTAEGAELLRALGPSDVAEGPGALALALAIIDRSSREAAELRAAMADVMRAQHAQAGEWRAHSDRLAQALVESVRAGSGGASALYREAVAARDEAVRVRGEALASAAALAAGAAEDDGMADALGKLAENLGPLVMMAMQSRNIPGGGTPPATPA